jgi:DNA replication protein DnaC
MTATNPIDTARLSLILNDLRLPAIKTFWPDFANRADKEGWPAARFLAALAEHEIAERDRRRIERHLNIIMFGPPGGGKSHLAAALGGALIENGWRVLYTRTTDLVQKLQVARQNLELESALLKLDKYHLLICDDLAYVTKDQAETSVLFELIGARYERRSMLITANQPFGEWNKVFPDQAMTLAAVDRLVHHATIFEMNVESYRRREALERKRGTAKPARAATIKSSS